MILPTSDWWDQLMASLAYWAAADARGAIASLLASFGSSTEPDFTAIGPIYNRMLAIALLLLGAVVALALVERIGGGAQGAGWNIIGRVLVAVFLAYSGLGVVEYVAKYAALIAASWAPDFTALSSAVGSAVGGVTGSAADHHVSVFGLILTALFLSMMSLLVYLELIVRSALVLTITVFVPLVCAMAVWPRMAGAATHLAEFLVGLLLSKFVVATVLFVGFHLVVPALVGTGGSGGKADWMESGIAVLLIAAFSPVAIFQALRFAHSSAGTLVRDLGSTGVGMAPFASALRVGQKLARHPAVATRRQQLVSAIASRLQSQGRS